MSDPINKTTELSGEQIDRAMAWWEAHESHVGRLIAGTRAAYPPSGSDKSRPELWKDAHWLWLARREINEAIGSEKPPMTAEELAEARRLLDHPDLSEETKRMIRADLFPIAMQKGTADV